MLNYKARARTQNFDILSVEARAQANWKSCWRGVRTPSRRAPGRSLVRSSLYQDHSPGLSPRWRRISDRTWCRRRAFRRCWVDLWRGSRRFRGKGIWAPRTVRSLGIRPLGGLAGRSLSGCTTRPRCWLPCVLAAFPAGSASRQFRGRSRVRQLSCTPPPRSAGDPAPRSAVRRIKRGSCGAFGRSVSP